MLMVVGSKFTKHIGVLNLLTIRGVSISEPSALVVIPTVILFLVSFGFAKFPFPYEYVAIAW